MPDQLDPLFDAVRGRPPPAPFAPAEAVRRRGRQRANRQAASAGVALLAVVGLGAGGLVAVAGEREPAPPPAASSPAPDSPGPAPVPSGVPGGWLLAAEDLPGGAAAGWVQTPHELLTTDPPWYWGDLCPEYRSGDYPSLRRRVDLAAVSWRNEEVPLPGQVAELVELFEDPDAAAGNVEDVRRVTSACSWRPTPGATVAGADYRIVAEDLAGDESLLIEMRQHFFDGETVAAEPHLSYAAVVRVGASVATIISGDPELLREVSPAAAARLE